MFLGFLDNNLGFLNYCFFTFLLFSLFQMQQKDQEKNPVKYLFFKSSILLSKNIKGNVIQVEGSQMSSGFIIRNCSSKVKKEKSQVNNVIEALYYYRAQILDE